MALALTDSAQADGYRGLAREMLDNRSLVVPRPLDEADIETSVVERRGGH